MPKKRSHGQFTKPQSTVHPSLSTATSAGHKNTPPSSSLSVNELISSSRASRIAPDNRPQAPIMTPSLPPAINHLLDLPEPPTPRPRTVRRVGEDGRRLPAGPPPPKSWLSKSKYSTSDQPRQPDRLFPAVVNYFPGNGIEELRKGSLMDMCLRRLAQNWAFHKEYDQHYLATLPTRLRQALLSYIAVYGPAEGINIEGLKRILSPPEIDGEIPEGFQGNGDFRRLDLAGSVGRSISFKQLTELVVPEPVAPESLEESWDAVSISPSLSLLTNLTHLSLSHPPPSISWGKLLKFTSQVPTITHLSLGYWPFPTSTPNSQTATMESKTWNGSYGGTNPYSHTVDMDFIEAASIIQRLSGNLYSLEYLDLEGCSSWFRCLRHKSENFEPTNWLLRSPNLQTVILRSGFVLNDDSSETDMKKYHDGIVEAKNIEEFYHWVFKRWNITFEHDSLAALKEFKRRRDMRVGAKGQWGSLDDLAGLGVGAASLGNSYEAPSVASGSWDFIDLPAAGW